MIQSLQVRQGSAETVADRYDGLSRSRVHELVAREEPLEIRLGYGPPRARKVRPISVTMRTPGNDAELAAGFLLTEGVIRDAEQIESVNTVTTGDHSGNVIRVELVEGIEVSVKKLERNFYTTSSCGVCGKASIMALRMDRPPRPANTLTIEAATLYRLPAKLRAEQGVFEQTGGLHAAALFGNSGAIDSIREDVGRHNAVDKLIGAAVLEDRIPLLERVLLLSGRASFELLQKAVMAGIPMVAAVGAPSSLAVEVAREFDITLIGFLRDNHFNIYNGAQRVFANS